MHIQTSGGRCNLAKLNDLHIMLSPPRPGVRARLARPPGPGPRRGRYSTTAYIVGGETRDRTAVLAKGEFLYGAHGSPEPLGQFTASAAAGPGPGFFATSDDPLGPWACAHARILASGRWYRAAGAGPGKQTSSGGKLGDSVTRHSMITNPMRLSM
eukprot:672648-Hanusia_phi.AAC.1